MGRKAKILSEVKVKVVEDYLKGRIRVIEIVSKLEVSEFTVREWIRKYQKYGSEGIITKSKNKYYSSDIKLQAINDFLAGKGSLYQGGYDALVDRRGKYKTLEELSESEKIAAQLKLLEAENRRLKMENDFLKKLKEIERR